MIVVGIWTIAGLFRICNEDAFACKRNAKRQETTLNIIQFLLIAGWVFIFIALFSIII